jgi:hypothetical protein
MFKENPTVSCIGLAKLDNEAFARWAILKMLTWVCTNNVNPQKSNSVAAARLAGSRLSKPTLAAGSARLTAKK